MELPKTIPPPPQRLLVFARLPERGRVKTRLARDLGEDRALELYRAMLDDLLRSVVTGPDGVAIEVLWAPTPGAGGEAIREAFGTLPAAMQTGATLGDRLAMAFSERFFFHRTAKIVAIGVDDPDLPRSLIDSAFALLDSCEWVVGPATDGGYYLIGCRGGAFNSDVFRDIAWGTSSVLEATLAKIRQWQASIALLPARSDLDVHDDLAGYRGGGRVGELLRAWGIAGGSSDPGSEPPPARG
jgi:rSAM/selenodomain-associated transferase 1